MLSFKLILGCLFGLLVTSIVVLGVVCYQNSEASIQTAERVRHTFEVLKQTDEISSLYKDIQLESNAFFISRDSSLFRSYLTARDNILPRIRQLRNHTSDDTNQTARIDSLLTYVEGLILFTDEGLESDELHHSTEQVDRRLTTNYLYGQNLREITQAIKTEEEKLLIIRERAHEQSIGAIKKTFFLLVSGIAVLLTVTFFSIRYNFNKRVKVQEDQKKASELFTKLFYDSPTGIVISRLDSGEIIDCNKAYTELVHYNKSEMIGKSTIQLGIYGDVSRRNELVKEARIHGMSKDAEVQLRTKGGEAIWVSTCMQCILINNENCLLTVVLDMTEHKAAEEKVKQALVAEIKLNKLKSNFITLASHEFRTPLTTIQSSAFLLENYSFGENKEKVSKHVSRIKGSVNWLTSILDEFLSLTKIEEGKVEPKKERINLKETIQDLCDDLKIFARPGQEIIYQHSGEEEITSDPIFLGTIVNNLVSNAIKYSNENDAIHVTSMVNEKVHLSVKDFGIGIAKEDQEHLFGRFFRASNAGDIQGTGLGLHIMKHHVDMLNGSIEVHSEPGKGSVFNVTFARG
jgi:PAS domain S-box-containing protein